MMRTVLKLVYIDSDIYWLNIRMNFSPNCGYNCCQTGGIEVSSYLASMGVKIEHTVGVQNKDFSKCISDGHVCRIIGHNRSQNCKNLCFNPPKHNDIHGKLNKINFCYKFCCNCHLGRLAAIIIDILYCMTLSLCWLWNKKTTTKFNATWRYVTWSWRRL